MRKFVFGLLLSPAVVACSSDPVVPTDAAGDAIADAPPASDGGRESGTDASKDAPLPIDAPADSPADVGTDAIVADAAPDGALDASLEGGVDAAVDATVDATVVDAEAGVLDASDATVVEGGNADAAVDAGSDAVAEAATEAGSDAGTMAIGVFERVSVGAGGVQGDGDTDVTGLSDDGRYVMFRSASTNLTSIVDSNNVADVFIRDRELGTTTLISKATTGTAPANAESKEPRLSTSGDYVVFHSAATDLVVGDTNGASDVFLWSRASGLIEKVSVGFGGAQANARSELPSVVRDGRYVAFSSEATNLLATSTVGPTTNIFVRDRTLGTNKRVSIGLAGADPNNNSQTPRMADSGRYVVFVSNASNLVTGDTNAKADVFRYDLQTDTTERVSLGVSNVEGNEDCDRPVISPDGRYVAFLSSASNLTAGDTAGTTDAFFVDMGATPRTILRFGMATAQAAYPLLSGDGRWLLLTPSPSFVAADTNNVTDVYSFDTTQPTATPVLISQVGGVVGNGFSYGFGMSTDGKYLAMGTAATNLVTPDVNAKLDTLIVRLR